MMTQNHHRASFCIQTNMGRTAAQQATEVRSKQVTAAVNAQQSLAVCKNLLRVAVAQVSFM